jgi:hypothetical protein
MSNHRKPPRGSGRTATNGKSPETKKPRPADKKEAKPKTVAAGMAGTALRGETASQESAPIASAKPAPRPERPVRAKPERPKPAAAKSAPKPAPAVATPAPAATKPASPATKPAYAAAKPAAQPARPPAPSPATTQHLLGQTVDTLEQSLKAAGRNTVAVNCKLLDFALTNINSSLDHAKDLAAARSPVRIMRLQMEYWHDCLEAFASQAQEFRALSAELIANANEPLRHHLLSLTPRAA